MQKQAPSIGRILVAVGFALSCFGLLLFLWVAFGGPVPLKSESYRITADFPEATTLAVESDVRIGGVSVGKVKALELAPVDERVNGQDATRVEMEIEPEYAPIAEDARAILRLKTLLGETYVELTSGSEPSGDEAPVALGAATSVSDAEVASVETIPEGGHLANSQVEEATQIDEIFNALDEETRRSFQRWQANAAVAIQGRGLDLNDSFGNLGPFIVDSSAVLDTLNRQKAALQGLVRDTGVVFEALTARDQDLAGVITNSNQTFDALASQEQSLREIFQILPTFQRESRLTFERLDEFQANTRPLVQDLIPVAEDLSPTLASIRELSPNLRSLFFDLDDLNRASRRGLPATRRVLNGLAPLLKASDPALANLNPILRFLDYQRQYAAAFITGAVTAASGRLQPSSYNQPDSPGNVLRVTAWFSPESLGIHQERIPTNRGNAYKLRDAIFNPESLSVGDNVWDWDCTNAGGEKEAEPDDAACTVQPDYPRAFGGESYPQLFPDP
jgi:phospholipid/cholesterol/gamma-HCH transport system substrate-binding protein